MCETHSRFPERYPNGHPAIAPGKSAGEGIEVGDSRPRLAPSRTSSVLRPGTNLTVAGSRPVPGKDRVTAREGPSVPDLSCRVGALRPIPTRPSMSGGAFGEVAGGAERPSRR